jgi:hypothetical protein
VVSLHGRRVPGARVGAALTFLAVLGAAPVHAAVIQVAAGGDLQAALNAAQPGDEVVLQAGATFTGTFILPRKAGLVTLRSAGTLPERRIGPTDAALLATLRSGSSQSALYGENTANWRITGLRFEPNTNGMDNLIAFQDGDNIELDRILFVAPEAEGQRRCVLGNGTRITLRRSHIAGCWAQTLQDSQAFAAWDGAGPYTIVDNYLEAASENVMFGGAPSKSPDRIPSDIRIEGNHFSKRLEWKGKARAVKNLLEFKSAKRVIIRNNLFERNWTDAQGGTAILFTPRNDSGPWSVVEDVTFERNIVRETEGLIGILGRDSNGPSGQATRITIRQNLLISSGTFLTMGSEAGVITIDHNTIDQGYNFTTMYLGAVWPLGSPEARLAVYAAEALTITNNLAYHRQYGLWSEAGIGMPGLQGITRQYRWANNVLAGETGWGQIYPPTTWQPSLAEYQTNFNSDYSLKSDSVYRGAATDGQDLGAAPFGGTTTPPPPPEVCGDKIDNDGDGQIDEGCPVTPPPAEVCGDKIDNDGDGQIDEGCPVSPPPAEVCGDKIDNDGDGQVDEGCVVTPTDTTAPTVTLWNVAQSKSTLKFRIEGSDPSGIAKVVVTFRGSVVATGTSLPLNVTIPLAKVPAGIHALRVAVTDRAGNVSTLDQTITK